MSRTLFSWKTAALGGFLSVLTVGVFAQSLQQTSAYYATPALCRQLDQACERQMTLGTRYRSTICDIRNRLCAVVGSSSWSLSSSSSSAGNPSCGANPLFCIQGYQSQCINGHWNCVPQTSASSVSSEMSCGPNTQLCGLGSHPACLGGQWSCVGDSVSSQSSSAGSCIVRCQDGYQYPSCTQDGHPIEYFVDPCRGHSVSSASSSLSSQAMECDRSQCGPQLGMPNRICPDGNGFSGPTGRCLRNANGSCGWEVRSCPVSSSSSLSFSSANSSAMPVGTTGACKVSGCSSELCVDQHDSGLSSCIWREQYACYRTAQCARQSNGQCGWTQTPELQSCLQRAG